MSTVEQILAVMREKGDGAYFGEAVTELEHALQCAHLARAAGSEDATVAAALLHDFGHLLHGLGEGVAEQGIDARHEEAGAAWLAQRFPAAVVDPVRLHVAAKRYLCAVEPGYTEGLSPASQLSLRLQGGPFTPEERCEFEKEPHWQAALDVRRWDDEAKVVGLDVPGLEAYRVLLERVAMMEPEGW